VIDCGLPANHPKLHAAAAEFFNSHLSLEKSASREWLFNRLDLCHVGFWLRIGSYFLGCDDRLANLVEFILNEQMDDGGWNCRRRNYPKTCHSSFHTTFNILDGLHQAFEIGIIERKIFEKSEARAIEFMLQHKMYRSDNTGDIVDERFTHLTYPSHWHYNILRGLDYIRKTSYINDHRLDDPIALLASRKNSKGQWPLEKRIPGKELFEMEKFGAVSRWTTLKMLRILKSIKQS
jgi:hypothetical protein